MGVPRHIAIDATEHWQKVTFDGTSQSINVANFGTGHAVLVSFDGIVPVARIEPGRDKDFPAVAEKLFVASEVGTSDVVITVFVR